MEMMIVCISGKLLKYSGALQRRSDF
jgi:hypothetical protein